MLSLCPTDVTNSQPNSCADKQLLSILTFQETTNPVLKNLYEKYIQNNQQLPPHALSGLSRVCSRSKYAFVTSDLIANYMKEKLSCSLEIIPGTLMKETLALAVAKNSSFLDVINYK